MSSHLSPKGLEMGWGCLSSQFGVEVGVEADENENNSSSSSVSNPVSYLVFMFCPSLISLTAHRYVIHLPNHVSYMMDTSVVGS